MACLQNFKFFPCNRKVSKYVNRVFDMIDQADIRMNKSFFAIVQEASRFKKFSFSKKYCCNYINKTRQL